MKAGAERAPRFHAVPSPSLIALTAALATPALGIAFALPDHALFPGIMVSLLAALAFLDLLRSGPPMRRLRAAIEGSPRLSLGKPGIVALQLSGLPAAARRIRIGIAWPSSNIAAEEQLDVALPSEAPQVRIDWPCQALQRGVVEIKECHVELASPFRLWAARASIPVGGVVRVYPDLLRDRHRLAALFLPHASSGWRPERMLGQGREFEQLRDYVAGDGWDEIHWKATAKRGRPITKLFQLERTQEIYVLLDTSRLSARPVGPLPETTSELEYRLNAALILGLAAQRQGDRFGFVAFGSRTQVFLRAATGTAHFHRCQDALHAVSSEPASPDFGELVSTLRQRLHRRALLVVLTALDDPLVAEEFERAMRLIARQHLILVHQIAPADLAPILHGPPPASVRDVGRGLAAHFRWKTLRGVASRLQRLGATFAVVPASELATATVSRYLQVKRQQRL